MSFIQNFKKPFNLFLLHRSSRIVALILIILFPFVSKLFAQTTLGRLEIPKKGFYILKEDSLIIDELVMNDSSNIVLFRSSSASYIKVNKLIIGNQCWIIGTGRSGTYGIAGKDADQAYGPCTHGKVGKPGTNGTDGEPGKNLTLEIDYFESTQAAPLLVRLNGGNGGDGGKGGNGGNANKSTTHCSCNGGNGSNGGNGGNGAAGGSLTFQCLKCPANILSSGTIKINLLGGYPGYGGEGGHAGSAGSGDQTSKPGIPGKLGTKGKKGQEGMYIYTKPGS
jgi:hypothetical protein